MTETTVSLDELRTVCSDLQDAKGKVGFVSGVLDIFHEASKHSDTEIYPDVARGLWDMADQAYSEIMKVKKWADEHVQKLEDDIVKE